jgi:hypothetical protein
MGFRLRKERFHDSRIHTLAFQEKIQRVTNDIFFQVYIIAASGSAETRKVSTNEANGIGQRILTTRYVGRNSNRLLAVERKRESRFRG